MPIRILPEEVAARIAAGEVVERPASVAKELIENALDAGAKTIRVEVREGGLRLIRVADDGCGIPADEVETAFCRHATSKLSTVDDLAHIHTLGFRGEALASIAAVSRVTMLTRTADERVGTWLRVEGGTLLERSGRGCPTGTVVTMENLFYNVPARLKFLKSVATEAGHVYQVVTSYALSYPECSFHLLSDGRVFFQSPGTGELYSVIIAVYGLEVARQLLEVGAMRASPPYSPAAVPTAASSRRPDAEVAVSGYISAPSLHRANRSHLTFFVNRRWVKDRSLAYAVSQAYHTMLPVGRYPLAVLNVALDPAQVDVNVHPAKSEIKFRDQDAVFSTVQRAVRATLIAQAPIPRLSHLAAVPPSRGATPEMWRRRDHLVGAGRNISASQLALEVQRTAAEDTDTAGGWEGPPWVGEGKLPILRVLGQMAQTYIVAEGPEGMYLIDQHAAHERVLYERLLKEHDGEGMATQALLEPAIVELTPSEMATLETCQEVLAHLGFVLEPFGTGTVLIRALPAILREVDPRQALMEILDDMAEGTAPLAQERETRLIASVCKQGAVKAGQTLSYEEMQELVRSLEATSMPRTCPHGRPTMIHLSARQLAREFERG